MKSGYVYIMTNKRNTVLYTGVASNLEQRLYQYKNRIFKNSFSARYNISKLVYLEIHECIEDAVFREMQIKNLLRRKKIALIEKKNPEWKDLSAQILVK
ncbi:MAG: GIY-YIG nuclease family protein [bacterium]